MDDDLQGYKDEERWVAFASEVEPPALPERPPPKPRDKQTRHALALAILGLLGFGLVASPLALALGQRARLRLVGESDLRDAGVAHTAVAISKLGLALHIAVAATVIPWLLFVLPLLHGAGR